MPVSRLRLVIILSPFHYLTVFSYFGLGKLVTQEFYFFNKFRVVTLLHRAVQRCGAVYYRRKKTVQYLAVH